MPINAILTFSFALTNGTPGIAPAFEGIQNEGIAVAADNANARFRNERREMCSDFMVFYLDN